MLIRIHPENPADRLINQVVDYIRQGGVVIYPTDTVYGLGCDIFNHKAVEKIARIKGIKLKDANFSFICHDLSHISDFTRHLNNNTFKLMKKYLPGPFTFILEANSNVPKLFKNKKKTVGIRIPANSIPIEIVRKLGNPILTTSIHDTDNLIDYTTDAELIHENFKHLVGIVIDGGYGKNIPSTVLNCVGDEVEIIRQGLGIFND